MRAGIERQGNFIDLLAERPQFEAGQRLVPAHIRTTEPILDSKLFLVATVHLLEIELRFETTLSSMRRRCFSTVLKLHDEWG